MTGFLKHGLSTSEKDRAVEMSKPLTPLSERPRSSYGSLITSVQTVPGLCSGDRKCVLRDGHDGAHWPKEN